MSDDAGRNETSGAPSPDKAHATGATGSPGPHEPTAPTPPGALPLHHVPAPRTVDLSQKSPALVYAEWLKAQGVSEERIGEAIRAFVKRKDAPLPPHARPKTRDLVGTWRMDDQDEKGINQDIARATGTAVRMVTQVKVAHKRRVRLYEELDAALDDDREPEYPADVARDGITRGEAIAHNERHDPRNLIAKVGEKVTDEEGNEIRQGAAKMYGRKRFPIVRGQ